MLGLLNSACVLCDQIVDSKISLCKDCVDDLQWIEHACKRCGVFIKNVSGSGVCGACQRKPHQVDYTISALHYVSPIDFFITELKFNQKLTFAAILSDLLFQYLQDYFEKSSSSNLPDLIIPVPLHNKRLVSRGFNQSVEIAAPISRKFSIPLCKGVVVREKNTLPQSTLNTKQRNKNIRNCFKLENPEKLLGASHIVILDDVVTTGSTCNELADLLKKSGVKKVGVWSVSRA